MSRPLLIATTGFSQEYCLRAIFRGIIDDRTIRIDKFFSLDSATAVASSRVNRDPDMHVAVVVDTESNDPQRIRDLYDEGCRRIGLYAAWARDRWHVALAVPDLRAWAVIDDHVAREYEKIRIDPATASTPEERAKIDDANYRAMAAKIGEWTAEYPFDLEKLKQRSRQVRELCAFIHRSQNPQPKPVLATAADWF